MRIIALGCNVFFVLIDCSQSPYFFVRSFRYTASFTVTAILIFKCTDREGAGVTSGIIAKVVLTLMQDG